MIQKCKPLGLSSVYWYSIIVSMICIITMVNCAY